MRKGWWIKNHLMKLRSFLLILGAFLRYGGSFWWSFNLVIFLYCSSINFYSNFIVSQQRSQHPQIFEMLIQCLSNKKHKIDLLNCIFIAKNWYIILNNPLIDLNASRNWSLNTETRSIVALGPSFNVSIYQTQNRFKWENLLRRFFFADIDSKLTKNQENEKQIKYCERDFVSPFRLIA